MLRSILFIAGVVFLGAGIFAQDIGNKSIINFEIDNYGINTVEGSFSNIRGSAEFNPENAGKSHFNISIPVRSINTGINMRDNDLQREKYFHAERFPDITFKSDDVKVSGNEVNVSGELTIKGVSKQIKVPFTYTKVPNGYLLKGEFRLDRYDFKVGGSGDFQMGREVDLFINFYVVE